MLVDGNSKEIIHLSCEDNFVTIKGKRGMKVLPTMASLFTGALYRVAVKFKHKDTLITLKEGGEGGRKVSPPPTHLRGREVLNARGVGQGLQD